MALIKLNDGESVTIQCNHKNNTDQYSVVVMRRGNWIGHREFNKHNNDKE